MSGSQLTVVSWGNNTYGQLGVLKVPSNDDDDNIILVPTRLNDFGESSPIKHVSAGWNHTLFLFENGVVYSCGLNDRGQCGNPKSDEQVTLERISALDAQSIVNISCGENHSLLVNSKGQMFAFGANDHGQLGLGPDLALSKVPRHLKSFAANTMINYVSCGRYHSVALSSGGQVYAWGNNEHGQIGNGEKCAKVANPILVRMISNTPITLVAAGGSHTIALTVSGNVFAWGKNEFGQLGLGDNKERLVPSKLNSLSGSIVRYATCGEEHSVILTNHHRVFSFGCGSSGQLGHNSFRDEYYPKVIVDLMGIDITQIACGRKHTLAYCVRQGMLYSFGLNVKGQLGIDSLIKQNSPVVTKESWKAPTRLHIDQSLNNELLNSNNPYAEDDYKYTTKEIFNGHLNSHSNIQSNFLVEIYSGGLQSFGILSRPNVFLPFRYHSLLRNNTLMTLNQENISKLINLINGSSDEQQRAMERLKPVFSHPSCLNGSFLKRTDNDNGLAENHGILISAARNCFIELCSNERISKLIVRCVKDNLLKSLQPDPFEYEALRIYIFIPLLPFFDEMDSKWMILLPFVKMYRSLHHQHIHMIGNWISTSPPSYFTRLVMTLKKCVTSLLEEQLPVNPQHFIIELHSAMVSCMLFLEQLYQINERQEGIVVYQSFYLQDLMEKIDIKADYIRWVKEEGIFSFCKFPFSLDAKAKASLLQFDAELQMKVVVNETNMFNIAGLFQGVQPVDPMLILRVRRDHLVQDTLTEIMKHQHFEFKKPLKVKFNDEEAEDAGGVRKEFFLLLMKELIDPKYGMFSIYNESQVAWFNSSSFESPQMFEMVGVICGLAIYNATIIDLPFPLCLYKKLLSKKLNLDDLRGVQPDVARNLQYMLDYTNDDFVETFDLNFQVTEMFFDQVKSINLLPNGHEMQVNHDNKLQYVDLYIDYKLNKSVSHQYDEFAKGFHSVCGGRVLNFFQPQELMEMVVGSQDYDLNDLEKIVEYKGEYYRHHPVIKNFWQVFHELSQDRKKRFLAFLTGSSKISILGISNMKFIIQPVPGGDNGDHLPVAHTCFNLLDLPRYPTLEMMRQKLCQAVENYQGFGLV